MSETPGYGDFWRDLFIRYIILMGHEEGINYLSHGTWTDDEWDQIVVAIRDAEERYSG